MMGIHFVNGLEVTVIDDSDHVGWAAALVRSNEIYMRDVKSMVSEVIKFVNNSWGYSNKIARLNILDHGNAEGFQIGTEFITMGSFPASAIELVKLKPYFANGAIVHLQHCLIGQNDLLILKLAKLLGVKVYAGTGYQNPVYRINFGGPATIPFENYVVADPAGSGSCRPASRPEIKDYLDIKIRIPGSPWPITIDL